MRKIFSLLPAILLALIAVGQDDIEVFGVMKDMDSGKTLVEGTVKVVDMLDTTFILTRALDSGGKYALRVPYDRKLLIHFDSPGMMGKQIVLDTRGVPKGDREGGHGMNVNATCIMPMLGVDYQLVEHPFAIARFDATNGSFAWDMRYVEEQKAAQLKLLEEHRAKRKELGLAK